MAIVGFVAHPLRSGAVALAEHTAAWLNSRGHEAVMLDGDDRPDGREVTGHLEDLPDIALAVSLGGDGTMLRTVDLVCSAGVPVLGVNLGHLGYLTAVEPEALRDALDRFLTGAYQVEPRMTLDVSVLDHCDDGAVTVLHRSALNDLVLQRSPGGRTVRAELAVSGQSFLRFAADSLIVATPTGSTAYNLSARGPIVSPRARVQIVTPVAPHGLFDRSIVLAADEEVTIATIDGTSSDLVVDGRVASTLGPGQVLRCRQGVRDALLVTFGQRDFHRILKRKFNLTDS